jgi:type I restriction enzyme S subunit
MAQNKNIPQGYKDSPLGVIPQEWEVKRLGDFCPVFKSGEGITSKNIQEKGTYPVYGGNGLRGYANSYTHNGAYVIIGRQGALCGNVNYIKGLNYISEHGIAVQTDKENDLLFCYFNLDFLNLNKLSESSAQPGLSVEKLLRYKVILPPLPEQQKIAEILTCWDDAIEKQTKLIEKLEIRKHGLIQQLLTGKKRLKGFEGEWTTQKIKEIAKEYSIKNKDNRDLIVLSCTKYDGLVASLEYFGRRVFSEDISSYKIVPNGYFAYATNHIEEGSIGYQNSFDNALISPMYTVFKTSEDIDDSYMYRLLKSHKLIYLYNVLMEGSINRRGGLRWEGFSSIKLHIPPLPEQTAIANILSTADEEIGKEKEKLSAFKSQKKGLMQQLLTGKKRVKI